MYHPHAPDMQYAQPYPQFYGQGPEQGWDPALGPYTMPPHPAGPAGFIQPAMANTAMGRRPGASRKMPSGRAAGPRTGGPGRGHGFTQPLHTGFGPGAGGLLAAQPNPQHAPLLPSLPSLPSDGTTGMLPSPIVSGSVPQATAQPFVPANPAFVNGATAGPQLGGHVDGAGGLHPTLPRMANGGTGPAASVPGVSLAGNSE